MKTVKEKYLVVGADFAGFPLKEAVVKHLKAKNRAVYESFASGTSVLYDVIAEISGLGFEMRSYDHNTGAASFRFYKK